MKRDCVAVHVIRFDEKIQSINPSLFSDKQMYKIKNINVALYGRYLANKITIFFQQCVSFTCLESFGFLNF